MAERNKYGLGRTIPSEIKREVRKRCGFGCVICGISIFDYEHFNPAFKDAKNHDPIGITLLCPQCNQKKARGMLSVETVTNANAAPKSLQQGFSNETFDFGVEPIEIIFAGVSFKNCQHLIVVGKIPILSVSTPEEKHAPYRLSGRFCDDAGAATLKIEDNVWSVGADNWDVECTGAKITIRKGLGDIVLTLKSIPPKKLVVERINMQFEGRFFRGGGDLLEISRDGKNWNSFKACSMENGHIGILIS